MKKLCQHENGKCSQCGVPLPEGMRRTCRPGRKVSGFAIGAPVQMQPATKCIHLGESTGTTVKVLCDTCGGKKQVDHAAYKCALHGRCLRTFRGPWDADHELEAAIYKLCASCEDKSLAQQS